MSTPLFPSEWSKIWIRGTFINLDGSPMAGQVSFAANVTGKTMVASAAKKLIAARPLAVTLDGAGYFQIQIPATNDPDITPLNFTYTVAEPTGRTYSITVPWNTATLSAPGDPLDGQQVIDLTSVVPSPGASGGVGQLLRGVGIESIVNNPSGGLLVTYTDGASSVVSIPDAVKGDKGDPGEPGPASTVPGPQGPPGEVSAAQLTSAIAALPFRADNTTTTGAAVGTVSALRRLAAGFELAPFDSDPVTPAEIGAARALAPTSIKTSNFIAVDGQLVVCDATAAAFTVTLPPATAGRVVAVRKGDSSANAVTITADGTDTIGSVAPASSMALTTRGSVVLLAQLGNWVPVSIGSSVDTLDARYGRTPQVDVFTANGTWTKPPWATKATATCLGGGGGGGGGTRQPFGTGCAGGAGGGGGGRSEATFAASALGATEPVQVGAGGASGVGATSNATNGSAGGAGGTSSFGSTRLRAGGGAGGPGGAIATTSSAGSGSGMLSGGSGGVGATSNAGATGSNASGGGPGGGGGGGVTSGGTTFTGGAGGVANHLGASGGGAAGTSPGGAGGSGSSNPAGVALGGFGGGGGGSAATGAAGNGGSGGLYAAGGGGGGSVIDGGTAGNGGVGGVGLVVVVSE